MSLHTVTGVRTRIENWARPGRMQFAPTKVVY